MKNLSPIYFATITGARNQLEKMVKILERDNAVYYNQALYMKLPTSKGKRTITLIRDSIPADIKYLCIVERTEQNPNNQLPQQPFFISSINNTDIEMDMAYLIPLMISSQEKVEEVITNHRLTPLPIINHLKDRLILDLISTFNMNEMEQPQISKSPFQILFVYDVTNNEIVYEMEEQHKVEEKEFRFFKTRGQETAYLLLTTDGRHGQELLGIMKIHYLDTNMAYQWLENISSILSSDKDLPKGLKEKAFLEAKKLYQRMIGSSKNKNFKNKANEIVFYCTQTDGKTRNRGLNILDIYYEEPEFALLWKNELFDILNSNLQDSELDESDIKRAEEVINNLYEIMIDEDFNDFTDTEEN